MPTDLEVIAQVEKAIGKELELLEQIDFRRPAIAAILLMIIKMLLDYRYMKLK